MLTMHIISRSQCVFGHIGFQNPLHAAFGGVGPGSQRPCSQRWIERELHTFLGRYPL